MQAKLLTNDLSSGSSCCIQFKLDLFFWHANFNVRQERLPLGTGRILSAIRDSHSHEPLKVILTPMVSVERCCRFIGPPVASGLDIPGIPPNSQPPGISFSILSTNDVSSNVYQQEIESTSQPETSSSDNVKLPEFQPVTPSPSHFHWGPVDSSAFC